MTERELNLKAFLDGELSEAEQLEVTEALAADESAERELQDFRELQSAFRTAVEPPVLGMERTMLALVEKKRTPWWNGVGMNVLKVAFALGVAGLLLVPNQNGGLFSQLQTAAVPATKSAEYTKSATLEKSETPAAATANGEVSANAKALAESMLQRNSVESKTANKIPEIQGPPVDVNRLKMYAAEEALARTRGATGAAGDMGAMPAGPLPSPMGGRLRPFAPGDPSELDASRTLDQLVLAVKSIAKQYRATLVTESAISAGKGKSFVYSVLGSNAIPFIRQLRLSIGQFGSVSEPRPAGAQSANPRNLARPTTADDIPLEDLEKELQALNERRVVLLTEFYEDAKPVKELDTQIDAIKKRIADAKKPKEREVAPNEKVIVQVSVMGT